MMTDTDQHRVWLVDLRRYYDPSGVVAHFPPVYVPKGGRQQDTTTPPSSSKKRRKGGARQAAAAAADEEEEGEEELVLPGDEVGARSRAVGRSSLMWR